MQPGARCTPGPQGLPEALDVDRHQDVHRVGAAHRRQLLSSRTIAAGRPGVAIHGHRQAGVQGALENAPKGHGSAASKTMVLPRLDVAPRIVRGSRHDQLPELLGILLRNRAHGVEGSNVLAAHEGPQAWWEVRPLQVVRPLFLRAAEDPVVLFQLAQQLSALAAPVHHVALLGVELGLALWQFCQHVHGLLGGHLVDPVCDEVRVDLPLPRARVVDFAELEQLADRLPALLTARHSDGVAPRRRGAPP
eukprot:780108-Pyramimonas_sp.AAC.1